MKLGNIVHFEPWGDEPLIKLSRKETVTLIEGVWVFIVLPILLFFICPWLGRCAAAVFE